MVDEDAEMAEKLNATFPGGQVPPARETSPESPSEEDEVLEEIKRVAGEKMAELAIAALGGVSKLFESLCLIGPSLSRIADAQEKMAKESEIYNKAYEHNVNQTHHSVHG